MPGAENGTLVSPARLSPGALRRLAEEFVTRNGTDYGEVEKTLDEKVAALLRVLEAGEAAILYDAASQTFDIVVRR
jgi:uncharacterized protein